MKLQKITGNRLRILLHVVGWAILFIIPSYLMYIDSNDDFPVFYITSLQTVSYAIIFYVNYLWLTPGFFFGNKKVIYFLSAGLLVLSMSLLMELTDTTFRPGPEPHPWAGVPPPMQQLNPLPPGTGNTGMPAGPDGPMNGKRQHPSKKWPVYNFLMTSVFITGFAIGLRYSDKVIQQEKQRKEAEKDKLNTELAFLKNQINPHFFFNTLNNIYSLVQTSVQDGQKAILQLSKLMRYLLYETEKGSNLLSQEIDFMRNYIELMKLRLSQRVSLEVTFPEDFPDVSIPPLIFLPFIENAFKHGISYRHPSFIKIMMEANHEGITFECSNSMGGNGEDLFRSDSGIGLENVKKRLSLLFPEKHHLQILTTEQVFRVMLHIDIDQTEKR
jgi:two-component system, LytTR family, sensor kinase